MPDLEGEKDGEMGGTFASSSFTSQNWKGVPSPACGGPPSSRWVLILPTLCLFHGQPSKLRFLFYKSPTRNPEKSLCFLLLVCLSRLLS